MTSELKNRKTAARSRMLRRAEDPADVPALDRAVAAITCRLLIALDRIPIDDTYASRALAACNCSWVWPEAVIRKMGIRNGAFGFEDTEQQKTIAANKHRQLKHVLISPGQEQEPWLVASSLVDPSEILAIKSCYFAEFIDNAQDRLAVAHATLEWLSGAPDPAEEVRFMRNARFLGRALGLNNAAMALVEMMSLVAFSDLIRLTLSSLRVRSLSGTLDTIAKCVGTQKTALLPLFMDDSPLIRCDIHGGWDTDIDDFGDALMISSPAILEKLDEDHADAKSFIESFLKLAAPTGLSTGNFPHLKAFSELAGAVLRNSSAQRTPGINVFLYGPPGTGKTEYAKALAQSAGLTLYEVAFTNSSGSSAAPGQRLGLLQIALKALEHHPGSAILLDEAEDVFDPPSRGRHRHSNQIGKAWLNNFLTTVGVPVLWTSNSIAHIDPAVLRRVSLLQEIDYPPQTVRSQLARAYLSNLTLDDSAVQAVARLPMLTPASLELTARTIQLAQPKDTAQAHEWVHGHLKASRAAQGIRDGSGDTDSTTRFDPRFANIVEGPGSDDLLHFMKTEPRMSLCLYGAPGTGKTEFARHLADQLGRELVTRTASDLLSKWVGESEQNIARMFDECAQSHADTVLLLDEADTFLRHRQFASHRWEVSQTNEFLARMERFPGTFICTTNLFEDIDPAVLRRFQFRLRFEALRPGQACEMFEATFGFTAPTALAKVAGLVPADFANVKRQLRVMRGKSPEGIVELLAVEARTRQGHTNSGASRMGFLATV